MIELFFAECKRVWIQFKRYPAESFGLIFVIISVFYGLFLGTRYIAGPGLQLGDRLDSIIVGYILWTLFTFILVDVAGNLQYEAQTGTLEQLFLSSYSTPKVLFIRALASLLIQLLLNGFALVIIMLLTGRFLSFPIALIMPLMAMILGAYGFSFALGALTLVFKRAQQILAFIQFSFLFLLTLPAEDWQGASRWLGYLIPMSPGAGLLRDLMARQIGLDWSRLAIAFLNGGLYFAMGVYVFRIAERYTKRRGQLGGY
jgi:ABC-2 type transport system permease protein